MLDTQEAPAAEPPPEPPSEPDTPRDDLADNEPLRVAAAYSWRLLVVGAAAFAVVFALAQIRVVALAVFLALLATALLRPPAQWLVARGWRPAAATAAVVGGGLTVLGGLAVMLVPPFLGQLDDLARNLRAGVERVGDWLTDGPLGLSERQIEDAVGRTTDEIGANSDALSAGS